MSDPTTSEPQEHEESEDCWCCPTVLYESGTRIIVHNSIEEAN